MVDVSRDWVFPQIEEWTSLWDCFHDAEIQSVDSDLTERQITLQLKLGFPIMRQASDSSERLVSLRFESVTHVHAYWWHSWPGPSPQHRTGMDKEVWESELRDFLRRGRVESVSIGEFQKWLTNGPAHVLEARGSLGTTKALELEGNSKSAYRLHVASETIITTLDGAESSLEELRELGERAWDALKKKR